ncbi:cysteine desulfurase [bacterium]|nr:cysteine desulfurase [bacterium]
MSKIYFDHSATTPVDKRVLDAMNPFFSEVFGNPSSIHGFGQKALRGVDKARKQVSNFLNCQDDELIFTSGATESNNLVLRGVIKYLEKSQGKKVGSGDCMDISKEDAEAIKRDNSWKNWFKKGDGENNFHIITSSIEHKSILEPCAELEKRGVDVTYLPVDSRGLINVDDVKGAIRDNTILVSVMYVNSEVGSVQPIREIGKVIKKINENRYKEWQKRGARKKEPKPQPVYFHTDATQAVNFSDCNIERLHLDFLSLSSHKIYGPKGVGALFVKNGSKIKGVQIGGGQERKIRSGTLNVPGIVGLGKAISLITPERRNENNKYLANLRDRLVDGLTEKISNIKLTSDREISTPSHAHFILRGAEGESILMSLDFEGIAISTGSACAAKDLHSSHVLKAMKISAEESNYAVRFTLGKKNTKEDIDKLLKVLPPIIERIRKMNPIYKK